MSTLPVGGGITSEFSTNIKLSDETFELAAYQVKGERDEQQDRYVAMQLNTGTFLVGVFDGHGDHGARIADVLAKIFPSVLTSKLKDDSTTSQIIKGLKDTFKYMDELLKSRETTKSEDSGSTAVVVVVTQTHYICANVGDSRAVIIKRVKNLLDGSVSLSNGSVLSTDHDVKNATEVARARSAGADMEDEYFLVGEAGLQLSRAFGDFEMKCGTPPVLLCIPDIRVVKRQSDDAFLWLFSDGITDAMINYEHDWYVKLASKLVASGEITTRDLVKHIVNDAYTGLSPDKPTVSADATSSDNITSVVVKMPATRAGGPTTAKKRKSIRMRGIKHGMTMKADPELKPTT